MPPPPLPIRTPRLLLRPMVADDATAFAAYRNDPMVAQLQDWDLPYTEDAARRMIDEQQSLTWPALGGWLQLAVEHNGRFIGDVGVARSIDGSRATLGYTLESEHQGRGFATEAVAAIVDALFADGVHRVIATVDPQNHASALLLDRLGFRYEGRDVASVRVRGEWVDDDRYALLASDRVAWLARDRRPPGNVELVDITYGNRDAVGRLLTTHSQERFVEPVARSYAEALLPDPEQDGSAVVPWMRAIEADGVPVGFVMLAAPTPTSPEPFLWRLLVDRWHQGRGIGTRALELLADHLRSAGHHRLLVSWVPERGGPGPFYLRLGFVLTGEIEHDEVVAALEL